MRLLVFLFQVEEDEWKQALFSFFYFFFLMSSYFILRPVRDEMGILAGIENMQWLFTGTFFAMLGVVPLFGYLVKKVPRTKLIPRIYLFFTLNILAYYFGFQWLNVQIISVVFFIWLSVFNLFVISIFWSFNSDLFDAPQAKRLYGPIAAGGSLGAILGPSITSLLSAKIGVLNLILVSAFLLALSTVFIYLLLRTQRTRKDTVMSQPISGSIWAGIALIRKSRLLQLVVVFILLFTSISTFLYFQQGHIVSAHFSSSEERTGYFGMRDLLVNTLTLFLQFFLTAKIIRRWGLTLTLTLVPLISCVGFLMLGLHPTIQVLLVFQVVYRSLNFALQRPSREILFTAVSAEERYKSKNLIDTAVYRGGDALSGWLFAGLSVVVASIPMISFIAIPIAIGWAISGLKLGRIFNSNVKETYEKNTLTFEKNSAS